MDDHLLQSFNVHFDFHIFLFLLNPNFLFKFDLLYFTFYDFSYFDNHILIYLGFKLEFHLHFPNNYPANWGLGEGIEIQLTRVSGSVLSMTLGSINDTRLYQWICSWPRNRVVGDDKYINRCILRSHPVKFFVKKNAYPTCLFNILKLEYQRHFFCHPY